MSISLRGLLGNGYDDFFNFKGRYAVIKGSRASKKSKDIALTWILRLADQPKANLLVVRKTYRSLENSCFTDLKWAVDRCGLGYEWTFKTNPLEATNIRTKQKIYFRGLDDPLKITSISVEKGYLCWCWVEEAYEITKEEDFDMLDESIRGKVGDGLFKQLVISFNPWNERHWLKRRFFDIQVGEDANGIPIYKERETKEVSTGSYSALSEDGDTLIKTTTYLCNEWLDEADIRQFERMKLNNPRRYRVAGLGNWGIVEGLVYENFTEKEFTLKDVQGCKLIASMDFGYTNDPTAIFIGFLDKESKILYVWDEGYETGLTNIDIKNKIVDMGYAKEHFIADSAEPKSIEELKYLGLKVKPAKKGKDSIRNGIQYIQNYRIIIHPRCVNFITEINNYSWSKDKFGKTINEPIDDFNHLMDAMRYGIMDKSIGSGWGLSMNKLL